MSNEALLGQLFSHIDAKKRELKDWATTWATNPKEAMERQKEAARNFQHPSQEELIAGLTGVGSIKMAGGHVMDLMKNLVKQGHSVSEAAQIARAFPVIDKTGRPAGYAQTIETPSGTVPTRTVEALSKGDEGYKVADFYRGNELAQLMPQIADLPVQARLTPKPAGAYYRTMSGEPSHIVAQGPDIYGTKGVRAKVAHETTHADQQLLELAQGGSPVHLYRPTAEGGKELTLWGQKVKANPEAVTLLKEFSRKLANPLWTGSYRGGVHGENVANVAKYASRGTPETFDTPLSMQMVRPSQFLMDDYIANYKKLQELKAKGIFDPFANPYELAPGQVGLLQWK